jgi:hypothetical protein
VTPTTALGGRVIRGFLVVLLVLFAGLTLLNAAYGTWDIFAIDAVLALVLALAVYGVSRWLRAANSVR